MGRSQAETLVGVTLRQLTDADAAAYLDFISQIPDGDRRFWKEDPSQDAATYRSVLSSGAARRIAAFDDAGMIIGIAGAHPGDGWSSHVAELRVLVDGRHRGQGIGRLLAQASLVEAMEAGCVQTYVEVIAEQEALIEMFQDMGFLPEALLPDFVRDAAGDFHDLIVMTHRTDEHAARTRSLGVEETSA